MTLSLGLFSQYPITASLMILLLLIGLTLTSYFASLRLKHKKVRLAVVLAGNTVAVLSIIGLAFDIQVMSSQPSVVYLVTNGATSQQIEQIDTAQSVFVMRQAVKSITNSHLLDVAIPIDIPSQILSTQAKFDNLHVLGDGLSASQWQDLQLLMGQDFNNISITFVASKPRIGLVNMSWPRELVVGQFVEVQGQLQSSDDPREANTIYQLRLLDPIGQIIETRRLKASERFSLSFAAKSHGLWVYRLQLSKANDNKLIADQPIAFSVEQPAPLRILIKQSAPSFETRQLKNWAAQFASQIRVLTQISQNKEIQQNINLSPAELQHITSPFTAQTLGNFDWLLIDGRALLALTMQQLNALQTAIKKGLGVYIIADNELVNAWPVPALSWLANINIQPLDVANYSAIPIWPHSNIEQSVPLLKARITSTNDSFLVHNNQGQILVSHSQIGLGQVALSLLNSTYSWQTSGKTQQYSHYWQSVINKLARPKQPPYWLNEPLDSLQMVNQPAQKCLLGAADSSLITYNQHPQTLILTQDLLQTERRCLVIWPMNEDWHKLTMSQNSELSDTQNAKKSLINKWFYTYAKQDWLVWQQALNHQASQNMAQQKNRTQLVKQSVKALDKSWFWGLLVLFLSGLWLERKLF